jgi:hypothetical protein
VFLRVIMFSEAAFKGSYRAAEAGVSQAKVRSTTHRLGRTVNPGRSGVERRHQRPRCDRARYTDEAGREVDGARQVGGAAGLAAQGTALVLPHQVTTGTLRDNA